MSDKQKEDGHEAVVDPLMNGERQSMPARGNVDRGRQKTVVRSAQPELATQEPAARAARLRRVRTCRHPTDTQSNFPPNSLILSPAEVFAPTRNAGDPINRGVLAASPAIGHFRVRARQLTP
jgi:hypothetical protein